MKSETKELLLRHYRDNPEEFERILQEVKENKTLQEQTMILHLYTCNKDHGTNEGDCRFHLEESMNKPWSQKFHKQWLDTTKKFYAYLSGLGITSTELELKQLMIDVTPMLKEATVLRHNKSDDVLFVGLLMIIKSLPKELLKHIKLKEL
jgi:hypothetical protein